jgi:cytochrome c oxidase subunit II
LPTGIPDQFAIMTRRHPGHLILTIALLSAVAFLSTAIPATGSGQAAPGDAKAQEPRVIEIVAKRFVFEPAEVEVTVGERVTLAVKSGDGVHGIEIKKFNVKKEIPRGAEPVMIAFTATETGRFPILCSEYCGNGHDDMKGTLVVKAREPQAP